MQIQESSAAHERSEVRGSAGIWMLGSASRVFGTHGRRDRPQHRTQLLPLRETHTEAGTYPNSGDPGHRHPIRAAGPERWGLQRGASSPPASHPSGRPSPTAQQLRGAAGHWGLQHTHGGLDPATPSAVRGGRGRHSFPPGAGSLSSALAAPRTHSAARSPCPPSSLPDGRPQPVPTGFTQPPSGVGAPRTLTIVARRLRRPSPLVMARHPPDAGQTDAAGPSERPHRKRPSLSRIPRSWTSETKRESPPPPPFLNVWLEGLTIGMLLIGWLSGPAPSSPSTTLGSWNDKS